MKYKLQVVRRRHAIYSMPTSINSQLRIIVSRIFRIFE